MEGPEEYPVGRGAGGDRQVEEPLENPGSACRWAVQSGSSRFPFFYRVGRLVPVEEEVRSEVSEWELRERREPEEERREEAEALGADDVLGAGGEPRCSFPPPRSWHRQARSRERATFSFVEIYGSIKGEDCELIVLQHYTGARSLYIQEGRRDKGRKTTPPSRCSGTQSCPDATSGPSSPDAHYSDIFFFFCSFLCDLPWCVSTLPRDRARRKAKGSLQRPASRGLRAENLGKMYAAIVEKGCMRVGINKKRKPGYERSAHAPSRGWHAARSK